MLQINQDKVKATQKRIAASISRHARTCLQFSGGKDSLASLYLLRPYWDRLIVLWGNPRDEFPETRALMESIRPLVAEFHEALGAAPLQTLHKGFPCDMVPVSATPFGRISEPSEQRFTLQSRYECCAENLWSPLQAAVQNLGITLVMRGQRRNERLRNPIPDGFIENGVEFRFPLEDWTKDEVLAYLESEGVPIPRQYAYGLGSLDCLHCTGYLLEGGNRIKYLKEFHPNAHDEVRRRLRLIQSAQAKEHRFLQIALGERESKGGEGLAD